MSAVITFTSKWYDSFRVLHHHNGFGILDSVRYSLWLARS
jgi:hypothetical protein